MSMELSISSNTLQTSHKTILNISVSTHVTEIELDEIKVYPNPTKWLLKIELTKNYSYGNSLKYMIVMERGCCKNP
jgi:hypothetical protein